MIKIDNKDKIYIMEQVEALAQENPEELARQSEGKYHNTIKNICEQIEKTVDSKNIILISGPSASGKTTSSGLIVDELKKYNVNAIVVSMDNFFKSRSDTPEFSDGTKDYENISALDVDLFKECIDNLLIQGKSAMPLFDFISGDRMDCTFCTTMPKGKAVIIIEGIHAFNPLIMSDTMRGKCNKIYICVESDFQTDSGLLTHETLRFCRRLIRDFHHRGSTVENTESFWHHVREGEERFILPFRSTADYVIDTTHAYEPLLYKDELLKIARKDENVLKYLNFFLSEADYSKKYVGSNAVVWEFLTKDK